MKREGLGGYGEWCSSVWSVGRKWKVLVVLFGGFSTDSFGDCLGLACHYIPLESGYTCERFDCVGRILEKNIVCWFVHQICSEKKSKEKPNRAWLTDHALQRLVMVSGWLASITLFLSWMRLFKFSWTTAAQLFFEKINRGQEVHLKFCIPSSDYIIRASRFE